jgi:L-alanine-DL-glutamate epimerase-like enolase superfamily enzyme
MVVVDLCWMRGLTEGRKSASMAEPTTGLMRAHDCIGPVGFAAAIHIWFRQPNTLIQKSVRAFYTGWYKELVTVVLRMENGYVYPMDVRRQTAAVFAQSDLLVRTTDFEMRNTHVHDVI